MSAASWTFLNIYTPVVVGMRDGFSEISTSSPGLPGPPLTTPLGAPNPWTSNGDSGNKTTNPIRRGSPMVKASDSHPKVPGSNPGGDLFYLIKSLAIKQFAKFQL